MPFSLQDEIALFGERLLLTPGLRYDHYKMEPKPGDLFLSGNRGTPIPENYQERAGIVQTWRRDPSQ